ncbi:DUF1302 domain-containing protein [Pseudomonas panipatensis]|uniref:Type V secretory pathway, adhesin AidA n=1 Tax=Pseudomonas panipatensis TaxID=428992 RepID=A0A1G8ILM4_9PSED|nr:DUF1302 domain-containing protein [Pseudomonas panipatensis]SDI19701.1 Protein of unknown function [Pseudomonas panipatensis]SMP73601.1 Protein of unknown function [Pseudomonas panipatensis]
MTRIRKPAALQPLALAIACAAVAPAHAFNFNIGEIQGQFDSTLSLGASWSTQSPSQALIATSNGGHAQSSTGDDGRLNFKRGETFSKLFKGIHDLELKYQDTGVFLRGKYWYDFELQDESQPFKNVSNDGRKEGAKSSGAQLLDAFVYHNYDIADRPGSVRLGKQVVSWGESTFISNSINAINPVDVAALRRPGAELKEALMPVNMFYLSQNLTEQLSAEGFYQLEWDQTVLDNCGTFFGGDVAPNGCNDNFTVGSNQAYLHESIAAARGAGFSATPEGVILPRSSDRTARDSGQWGLALRWQADNTDYGAYAMNYHSRTPFLGNTPAAQSIYAKSLPLIISGLRAGLPAKGNGSAEELAQGALIGNSKYFFEYPEDIRLYGLSFATTLPEGTAWSGEISYRPNMPLAINTNAMTISLLNPAVPYLKPLGISKPFVAGIDSQAGQDTKGYVRKPMTQAQTTFTHFFDQVMGADRLTLVGEVGMTHLSDLPSTSDLQLGRSSEYGLYGASGTRGFYTSNSWGYRARGILDYSDVFAGVNLKPNLAWSHDVEGYGPTFNQGAKAVSLGLDAEYRSTYTASLAYTNFFGGDYNTQVDRDFLALSVGMSF